MTSIFRLRSFSGIALIVVLGSGCYARPGDADLERVKQQFLVNRFQAPFFRETRDLSDMDIFNMTCENNRVRCEPLLEMLKKSDPHFYETLTAQDRR